MKKNLHLIIGLVILVTIFLGFLIGKGYFFRDSKSVEKNVEDSKAESVSNSIVQNDNINDGLEILGVKAFTPVDKVIQILGEPLKKEQRSEPSRHHPDTVLVYYDTWYYKKVELFFMTVKEKTEPVPEKPDKLIYILTTDERFPTKRGIKVGDSVEKLIEIYGSQKPENQFYSYGIDLEGYEYLDFKVENGKVTLIEYSCIPD